VDTKQLIEDIVSAKAEERRRRAQLPFMEKIRAVVRMQRRQDLIYRLRGKSYRIWDIEEDIPEPKDPS
jgi:hypothetical protein